MHLRATARTDRRTKDLVKRLHPHEIAVIDHPDLDETAAMALVQSGVLAVVNASPSCTGRYPNPGPRILARAGVPLFDADAPDLLDRLSDGADLEVDGDMLLLDGELLCPVHQWTAAEIDEHFDRARENLNRELESFIRNTLTYAAEEVNAVLEPLYCPDLRANFKGRHALVVVRGKNYRQDLMAIKSYLRERRPVLIGVDGGADVLLEAGFRPDLIVGDMDSVSDAALRSGAELMVHAYPNGQAPGLHRLQALGLTAKVLPAPGTSEDVAMLLAFEQGAELIVAVGTHTGIIDFMEKGRKGMSSTLLTRMKIGSLLVDAKGVSELHPQQVKPLHLFGVVLAALVTATVVFLSAPFTRNFLGVLVMQVRLAIGL